MGEREGLAAVVELPAVNAVKRHVRISVGELRRIAHQHEEAVRGEHRAVGESERDSAGEREAGEVQFVGAAVFEFDKLKLIAIRPADWRRVVHDFGERQRGKVLRRIKHGFDQGTPLTTAQNAGTDERG